MQDSSAHIPARRLGAEEVSAQAPAVHDAIAGSASCRFRDAEPADAQWLASRLPADRLRGQSFIAQLDNHPVAAFAVARPLEAHTPPGLAVALHLEPNVPLIIGIQIIRTCHEISRRMEFGPLYSWPHPIENTPAARLYATMGFESFDCLTFYAMDIAEMTRQLRPLHARVSARSPLEIVPLHRVDPQEVLGVWERQLGDRGGLRATSLGRIAGKADRPFEPNISRAVLRGGRASGVLLATCFDQDVDVDVVAMDAEARASGAVVQLLFSALTAARGCGQARWCALSRAHFTHRLARHLSVVPLNRRLLMRCTG